MHSIDRVLSLWHLSDHWEEGLLWGLRWWEGKVSSVQKEQRRKSGDTARQASLYQARTWQRVVQPQGTGNMKSGKLVFHTLSLALPPSLLLSTAPVAPVSSSHRALPTPNPTPWEVSFLFLALCTISHLNLHLLPIPNFSQLLMKRYLTQIFFKKDMNGW